MGMSYIKAFYDWLDTIEPLTDAERGRLFTALLTYGRDGIVPDGMGRELLTFYALKNVIQRGKADYNKRVENGKKGGRPKVNKTEDNQEKPKETTENQEKPKETKGKKEKEKEKEEEKENINKLSGKPDDVRQVIEYLNEKCGTHYKANTPASVRLVRARIAEGFTVDDFKTVIDTKYNEWSGGDMAKFLRPETLFGTKFESYLNKPIKRENGAISSDLYERAMKQLEKAR